MKAADAIRKVVDASGVPITHIGPTLGLSLPYVNVISRKSASPRSDTLSKILGVCGYKLCAVPENAVTEDMVVID